MEEKDEKTSIGGRALMSSLAPAVHIFIFPAKLSGVQAE